MNYKDILKVVKKEIGVCEKPSGSNKQKYGVAYGMNGAPWCVIFLWWAFKEAKASDLFCGGAKTASCGQLKTYAQTKGQWVTSNYKPGDLVMMNFKGGTAPSHIGFLVSVDGSTFNTIEGNTSSSEAGSQSNGGMVAEKKRNKSVIVGAYRPKYEEGKPITIIKPTTTTANLKVNAHTLKEGSKGNAVKVLQAALNVLLKEDLIVDGDFGPATKKAVIAYQKANRLKCGTADGICGERTWNCLLS